MVVRHDPELGDAPAAVADADQTRADRASGNLDEERPPSPSSRVEIRIRHRATVDLQQVGREESFEFRAIFDAGFA